MENIKKLDHTATYKVVKKSKYVSQNTKNGKTVEVPRITEYNIEANGIIIAHIPDYLPNPAGVATMLVKLLKNNGTYKLES